MTIAVGLALAAPAAPLEPLEVCAARVTEAPGRYESYLCYFDVGGREGRLDEAASALDRLAARDPHNGWPWLVRGAAASERRESGERQRVLYTHAAELLAAAGEARGEVLARTNLGRIANERGDGEEARRQVGLAQRAADAGTDPEARLRASVFEASQLVVDGRDLGRARRILLRAESGVVPDGPPGLQLLVLRNLSQLEEMLGFHEEAITRYERLVELRLAAGNPVSVPRLRFNILTARHSQRAARPTAAALPELRALAEETRANAREQGDRTIELRTEALLADLWRSENPGRAARHLERCAALARTLPSPTAAIRCRVGAATVLAERDPAAAARELDRAMALAEDARSDPWVGYVAQATLRAAWRLRDRAAAAANALAALDVLEGLRAAQADGDARIGILRERVADYHWLAARLLEGDAPDVGRAFAVSERLRARVLQDALARDAAITAPDADAGRRRREIVAIQRRLLDPALLTDTRAALIARLRPLEALDRAEGALLPGTADVIGLAEARARLAPDEALLVYLVDLDRDLFGAPAGGSWLIAITRDRVSVRRLPDRLALEAAVPMFVGMLEARDGGEAAAAVALHRQLVGDAIGPEVRRVIVVPDGVLHALPFAALRAAPDEVPLGVRLEVATVPSVSLWARWKALPAPQARQGALVVASPALAHEGRGPADVRGGVLAQGLMLGPLAHARREGARSRRAIGRDSRLLAGERASEAALKGTDLRPFAILHFATHAVADDAFPDRSAVVLAAGSEDEDGLLQPREIAALGLEGRAVVLSACQTAAGAYVGGEGVLSLARSFFEAGARTVVAGLWRLRDDETERLMRDLYEGLARGDTMGESLRAARARAVAEGAPPAAWAGVVVLGDQDFALPPAPFAWWRVVAAIVPLTIAAAVFWVAWRRRG